MITLERKCERLAIEKMAFEAQENRMRRRAAKVVRDALVAHRRRSDSGLLRTFAVGFVTAAAEAMWIDAQEKAEALLALDGYPVQSMAWWTMEVE